MGQKARIGTDGLTKKWDKKEYMEKRKVKKGVFEKNVWIKSRSQNVRVWNGF